MGLQQQQVSSVKVKRLKDFLAGVGALSLFIALMMFAGYESYKDYHKTAGRGMADELVKRYLVELSERRHWEERDVVTA